MHDDSRFGASVRDCHAHFHGSLPSWWFQGWAGLRTGDKLFGQWVRWELRLGKIRQCDISTRRLLGRSIFFDAYRAREQLVTSFARESSWEDVYRGGIAAIEREACVRGVDKMRLFLSAQMGGHLSTSRVRGALRALMGGRIDEFRVSFSRRGGVAEFDNCVKAISLLAQEDLLYGFDVSGLDSWLEVEETLRVVDSVSRIREVCQQMFGRRFALSVHWGESIPPDGPDAALDMLSHFRGMGVDAIGHGFLGWAPEVVSRRRSRLDVLSEGALEGFELEFCPEVMQLYGADGPVALSEVGRRSSARRVVWGSDSPALLPATF